LSLANFDQTLEDMVPEDLLSEPVDGDVMDVCADVFDAGFGSSRAASRASSTLERGLEGHETDLDHPAPMEVSEGPLALEVAVAENSALKDDVVAHPAPEGVAEDDSARVGRASCDPAPRVLPETIQLEWVAQTMTQPPRVSERGLPLVLPRMFT
jgi:hypothetical protein